MRVLEHHQQVMGRGGRQHEVGAGRTLCEKDFWGDASCCSKPSLFPATERHTHYPQPSPPPTTVGGNTQSSVHLIMERKTFIIPQPSSFPTILGKTQLGATTLPTILGNTHNPVPELSPHSSPQTSTTNTNIPPHTLKSKPL